MLLDAPLPPVLQIFEGVEALLVGPGVGDVADPVEQVALHEGGVAEQTADRSVARVLLQWGGGVMIAAASP